jgi:hypothetical protein
MLTDTICAALSAAGLGIAVVTAYRRRFLAATRIAAYALLPVGLAMTGILDWIADLVLKPTVWLGFAVLGVSWLLFAVSRVVERRRSGGSRKGRGPRRTEASGRRDPIASGGSAPSLDAGRNPAATGKRSRKASGGGASSADDFSDIEAILKKHGI